MSEVRYASLMQQSPETAKKLFVKAKNDSMERIKNYQRLSNQIQ